MKPVLTVLDDYQDVALSFADWSPVADRYSIVVVTEHVVGEALVELLRDSEVVVAMRERTPFPASVLRRLPVLRLLVTTGMSNAAIDVSAATELGIVVSGTASASDTAVPELVFGMMVALLRHIPAEHEAMRSGGWQHTVGTGLAGQTLGLVGLGRLGTRVARLADAFQMQVSAWSPNLDAERARRLGVRPVARRELFSESDVVSLHMRLTPTTTGLVAAQELAWMRSSSYLLNTSRGPLIDQAALVEALVAGRIAGAGLDVYDVEPLPPDHVLRRTPNVLLLPHIGYVTTDGYGTFYSQAVEDVLAYVAGEPVRVLG
jgi:phosphoglycerate dehydrogenase-like enzyme